MIQQKRLQPFIEYIKEYINPQAFFEVETNGTIMPNDYMLCNIDLWNCSPKLRNAGMETEKTFKKDVIEKLNTVNAIFKFVINDIKEWVEIQKYYLPLVDKEKIYLMPAGENQTLLKENKLNVVELAKENYLNFTTRLHIEIWNKKTGV